MLTNGKNQNVTAKRRRGHQSVGPFHRDVEAGNIPDRRAVSGSVLSGAVPTDGWVKVTDKQMRVPESFQDIGIVALQPKQLRELELKMIATVRSLTPREVVTTRWKPPSFLAQQPVGLADGFKKVCEKWSLELNEMACLLHLEEELGLCNLILSGQAPPMTGDLKDRMALVAGISIGLAELFEDDIDAEMSWLKTAYPELDNRSPLDHMLTGEMSGLKEVLDLLDNVRGLR